MAKTTKKSGKSTIGQKSGSAEQKQTQSTSSGSAKASGTATLSHQQIEDRAREIWQKKGCPAGHDEENWREAESQLKQELGIRK